MQRWGRRLASTAGLALAACALGPDDVAPSPPRDLRATVVGGAVELAWTDPVDSPDLAGTAIVRWSGSDGVADPAVEVELVAGQIVAGGGVVLHVGTEERFVDRTFDPCAPLVYRAYAIDDAGLHSERGAEAVVAGGATLPAGGCDAEIGAEEPSDLAIEPRGSRVRFTWIAPRPSRFDTMRLMVREGAPIAGASDPEATPLADSIEPTVDLATLTFLPGVDGALRDYHFAVYACREGSCDGAGAHAVRSFSLLEALRGGGHVVYLRHGEADVCDDRTELGTADETESPGWWASCDRDCDVATAQQLSEEGEATATTLGAALRDLEIPFDRVLASEMCRARETAERLALGAAGDVEQRPELTPFVYGDGGRCEAVRALLGGVALGAEGANAILVGHGDEPAPCLAGWPLEAGEAMVFRPGEEGPLGLARIASDGWEALR
jgi:hypothetical protein